MQSRGFIILKRNMDIISFNILNKIYRIPEQWRTEIWIISKA